MIKFIQVFAILVIGIILGLLFFSLGMSFTSNIFWLSMSIAIALLIVIAHVLIKYYQSNMHRDYVENLVSTVESIVPRVDTKKVTFAIKAYLYRHLLNIFLMVALFIAGILASILLIKQNNIMKDQNYLICQQTQYLAIKFNPKLNTNKELYDYFERLKAIIRELLSKSRSFQSSSEMANDINNNKYNNYLPQKEFTQILDLRKKIITIERDLGPSDPLGNQNYLSLVKEYKQLLKGFYDLIVNKEDQMKAEEKEKTIDFNDCKKYNE